LLKEIILDDIVMDQLISDVARKIRELRVEKQYSLQRLAGMASLSSTAIHKIERGEITPTIITLVKIAAALGKKVSYFLGDDENEDTYAPLEIVEFSKEGRRRRIINTNNTTLIEHLAVNLKEGILYAAIYSCEPGVSSIGDSNTHEGEEFIYMLDGSMEVTIKNETYLLTKGDSIHFFSAEPHSWKIVGDKPNLTLWVITPPPTGGASELW